MMNEFLEFIKKTPTGFHATKEIENILLENNFIKLDENSDFKLELNKNYFLTRNNSSVIAFKIPENLDDLGFNITAAHLDSPTFKLKPNFSLDKDRYQMLNTEVYGGPIYMSWLDRPLNIAGRVIINNNGNIETKLLSFDKGVCLIPNLCIHYNRNVNTGVELNPQNEMLPILKDKSIDNLELIDLISNKMNVNKDNILGYDLYLALLDRGTYAGLNNEFIMAPQIDNLECSFGLTKALINSKPKNGSIDVMALFDSEEIGSRTRAGADSNLLDMTLERISLALNIDRNNYIKALNNSFFISADNAQGFHPSYPQKFDSTNRCYLNDGIVIKNAARGSYTTDAFSLSIFKMICDKANAKYQYNTNRSDVPGGSTLGAISLSHVSIPSVDIGLAQLSMHSAYETAGSNDLDDLVKAIKEFYEIHIDFKNDGRVVFK